MAPSFFKDFRRRSKANVFTDRSTESSDASNASSGTVPTTKSTSTLNSTYGSQTPPSALPFSSSSSDILQLKASLGSQILPARTRSTTSIKRYSTGMHGLGSPSSKNGNSSLPTSPYAPRITSINDGAWVNQKIISIYGTISDPSAHTIDGTLTVSRLDDDFPPTYWPVCDSHFKALVYLNPGPNKLRVDFASPKLMNSASSNPIHSSYLTLHAMLMNQSPPLQLVILLGKDSPGTFDTTPARAEKEGNELETAIAKFRMAAYLWQAFTAEQMWRNRMGRRCFRFEEEWQTGTSNNRDRKLGIMRNEAKIHIVRSEKTVAEIRNLDRAPQSSKAEMTEDLFNIATDAVRKHFKPLPGQKQYVSVLILDSHWDKEADTIRGHATLGRVGTDIQLAIFGSHALHSYPSSFEEVVPAFTNCTRTDTNYVGNDCGESGSSWEAASLGIGAHLHEIGHQFGCPHQESGIMLRDYVTLNRSFIIREAFSTRTGSKGGLVLQKEECVWHRLDCLRFRSHPCFKIPGDLPLGSDDTVHVWPVDNRSVLVTAATGIAYVEMFAEEDDVCHAWTEYGDGNGSGPIQRLITLTELELRSRLPENRRKSRIKLCIKSFGGRNQDVADFGLLASGSSTIKLSNGQPAFRSAKSGLSELPGSEPQEVIFHGAVNKTKLLTHVKVYHGLAIAALEFIYEDSTSQLFGKKDVTSVGSEFPLDTRRGEYILGFYIRSGLLTDGIQILTTLGRKSELFGNSTGGSPLTLIPPRGFTICGISGSYGQWMNGFSLIITR